jgi:integrase
LQAVPKIRQITMPTKPHVVKYRTISISVYPWTARPGAKEYWKFHAGKKTVVRSTLEKAKTAARAMAEEIYLGQASVGDLTDQQRRAIRRLLDADPALGLVDEYLVWYSKQSPRHACAAARDEYLAAKRANQSASPHHLRSLRRHLSHLPDMNLADIGLADLPALTGAPRSKKNRLDTWRAFFVWCQQRGYLPAGPLVIDGIESPRMSRITPSTWSPDELHALLRAVRLDYLPWLALAAWAGIRTEEICPDRKSAKSPLLWSDFRWDRGIIIVRAETSKTGQRRIVPILPPVAALLPHDRVGRVGPLLPPHQPPKGGEMAETTRLGRLVGGWKRNALRHSFISYRAAQVGSVAQAALEAGHSESVSRRAYQDAKSPDEAAKWFAIPEMIERPADSAHETASRVGRR